jgi:transposase
MTLRPQSLPPVPETTAAAVQAAFPKGNLYVELRAEFGPLYDDRLFADLYPLSGRPVEVAPWRLALVVVMQYIEGLTDRQAADAVRRCIDWKYALSRELSDPGFNFTLLHDFRQRLLAHGVGQRFLDTFLAACKARGWIKPRGTQRTDSTSLGKADTYVKNKVMGGLWSPLAMFSDTSFLSPRQRTVLHSACLPRYWEITRFERRGGHALRIVGRGRLTQSLIIKKFFKTLLYIFYYLSYRSRSRACREFCRHLASLIRGKEASSRGALNDDG